LGREASSSGVHAAGKKFGVIGVPDRPRFTSAPEKLDATKLGPPEAAAQREHLSLASLLFKCEGPAGGAGGGRALPGRGRHGAPGGREAFKIPGGQWQFWIRDSDRLPARLGYQDGKGVHLLIEFQQSKFEEPWAADKWK